MITNQQKPLLKITKLLASLSELNPQLLREVKGKLKITNIVVVFCLSAIVQLFIVLGHLGKLPDNNYAIKQYSRYCFGKQANDYPDPLCHTNLLGHWDINWQLFWLDSFVIFSVILSVILLVIGVYLLITDLIKEQQKGTLDFIRFSPQSAKSILVGKILGVPILLYIGVFLALPLRYVAAFQAGISLSLIISLDLGIVACCWLFYSVALLFSLLKTNFTGFKPWLFSGTLTYFLLITISCFVDSHHVVQNNILDWLLLFNPLAVFPYIIEHSNLINITKDYLSAQDMAKLSFYGQHLWTNSTLAIGFILFNFYIWQHWTWQGLKRCFETPNKPCFSKSQSYWITAWFVFYALGFTLQATRPHHLLSNFVGLQFILVLYFLVLMALLNPRYQTLQDWTRYRHQFQKSQRMLWKDLILGEKSPGIVAVAVNLAIATIYIIPASLVFEFNANSQEMLWGLIIGTSFILICGVVAQSILLIKHPKRAIFAIVAVLALIIVPPFFLVVAEVSDSSSAFLISFLPIAVIKDASFSTIITVLMGQWLTIALSGFAITRQVRKLGKSEMAKLTQSAS